MGNTGSHYAQENRCPQRILTDTHMCNCSPWPRPAVGLPAWLAATGWVEPFHRGFGRLEQHGLRATT